MKKNRNLAVAAFCGALLIFAMQSQAAAQQKPEVPKDLGENKGTGDPRLPPPRGGSWDLVRIKTTAKGFEGPRETKDLDVDTLERKGIDWIGKGNKISAAVVFTDLKKTVKRTNREPEEPILTVLVKMEVMKRDDGSRSTGAFVSMHCSFDVASPSGERLGGPPIQFREIREPVYYPATKKTEFTCGGHRLGEYLKLGEDFILNYQLKVYPPHADEPVDVTYHFSYQWAGYEPSKPIPPDTGAAPTDREGQYKWAQKQDASALESRLISNAARLFNSPSVSAERLSSAFADVSIIIADRAAKANFSADDKDAASSNWSTHKNWAAHQGPKISLDNLQQRLSAAFSYLSRSQKDLFFADVSVALSKAEVGGPANEAVAQEGPFVKPQKNVFAVDEDIAVEYGYVKSTGWDWVVIAEPGKEKTAKGSHTGIDDNRSHKLEPGDNSLKDRRGTKVFEGLPEGKYVAKYISWPNGHAVLTSTEFTVGKASPPPPPGGPSPTSSSSGDLTGLWRNPGAAGVYRVRQIGSKLVWGLDAIAIGSFANIFQGQITGDTIDGVWEDLPGSPTIGGGRMLLKIESACRFVRVSSVNPYGADVWVKKDSKCDSAGLTQRLNPDGAKPASTQTKPATGATDKEAANAKPKPGSPPKTKPKIEESPVDRGRTNAATAPTNKPNKPAPAVEEIPEDNSTKIAATKPARKPGNKPPVVEEIPESASPNVASNRPRANTPQVEEIPETSTNNPPAAGASGGKATNSPRSSGTNQPKTKPKKEKKPRDPNKPDIWTLLGGAVREAITGQPNPGQTQPGAQAPPQTAGCQTGPYSLWALNQPRANEQVWMRFTAPAGRGTGSGDWVGIFRAGETQSTNDRLVSWMYLTSPDCVERFNLPAGQFDAYIFDASSFRATGNRSPISRGVRLVVNP